MIEKTKQAVDRIKQINGLMVVGDNPDGIDLAAINHAIDTGVEFTTVGVADKHRYPTGESAETPTQEECNSRDELMCRTADMGMFIVDGKSPEIREMADFMASLPCKQVFWVEFKGGKSRTTELGK